MRRAAIALWAMTASLPAGPAASLDERDSFDSPQLSAIWNRCQAVEALLSFGGEGTRSYLAMDIDGAIGDAECKRASASGPEAAERLGPSLVPPRRQLVPPAAPSAECPEPEKIDGREVTQRNELRFRQREYHRPVEEPHWYSITFKLTGLGGHEIPDCGSVRWVIAQWKYDPDPVDGGSSPFLAQRFDNGVLHITVQDGDCRCVIAKADGDYNRMAYAAPVPPVAVDPLRPVAPLECKFTREGPEEGQRCPPASLELSAPRGVVPMLPDPRKGWVRMTYRVLAHGPEGARIDIYADGGPVVRVTGRFAPGPPLPSRVKFKFGHYRDKIPNEARLMVDEVCLGASHAFCDPSLQRISE